MKKIVHWILGIFLLILAIIGFFLPFFPGFVFLAFGIGFLAPKKGKKIIDWTKTKIKKKQ